jgi:hypothetical protein
MKTMLTQYILNRSVNEIKNCVNSHGRNCGICTEDAIQKMYESLLARNILNNRTLCVGIYESLYRKLILAIMRKVTPQYIFLINWRSNPTILPISQKNKYWPADPDLILQDRGNIGLSVDLLEYFGKYSKVRELYHWNHNDFIQYMEDREQFYAILMVMRGKRIDQLHHNIKRSQYGILDVDHPMLNHEDPTHSWKHWSRDTCKMVETNDNNYQEYRRTRGMPLACGISGSAALSLWTMLYLLNSGVDDGNNRTQPLHRVIGQSQLREFIITIAATLTSDGGHTLNEVLAMVQLTFTFIVIKKALGEMTYVPQTWVDNVLFPVVTEFNALGYYTELAFRPPTVTELKFNGKKYDIGKLKKIINDPKGHNTSLLRMHFKDQPVIEFGDYSTFLSKIGIIEGDVNDAIINLQEIVKYECGPLDMMEDD